MGFLGLGEPSLGTAIIFLGAWINRDFTTPFRRYNHCNDSTDVEHKPVVGSPMANFEPPISNRQGRWRQREISLLGFCKVIDTPNTGVFQTRLLSKVLLRFPFIVEIIYWALIYGIYQMGRALLAERLNGSTVEVARHHALQVIRLEEKLHMFWEPDIQRFFLQYPGIMYWINRIYSFVHLPATITFLVGLYWFAITRNRAHATWSDPVSGPYLYESKRRTLAICNLLAFCVFSTWPCMPPRLLGDSEAAGATAESSRSYGFVDTVHGSNGALSVFNTRRWTNQLAAMPSLHFGYSLLVGLTVMQLPIAHPGRSYRLSLPLPFSKPGFEAFTVTFRTPSLAKLMCQVLGFLYPALILTVIVATANHFIMDAVAGATICLLAHRHNEFMLNFLPLEDCFLWCLRIHKPVQETVRLPKDLDCT
ncbi:hypothetical protein PV05_07672 [Exophiala xenobiotica]|uniref:Inositolphosphotransferase Aur1/Ipt1 domain-containing protein n=1 Tax=Exophiala xenobiotica TaxID=348802 RepID=A0A0D2EJ07_9EURO|nr:uncharacterized protein PV05_07672 [Exophiala xenobiotica]KIW55388.1 hypothetical protein PV05_07672 [Exophiala xenobiotica]